MEALGCRGARRLAREVRKRVIRRRLRSGAPLTAGPLWVQIGIDERCNYRCAMCGGHSYLLPQTSRSRMLSLEAFAGLVSQLREMGTQRLDIGGTGEPMLHPDLLEMLRQVKNAGMRCTLITNGSLLTPKACDRFIAMGLDSVNISINSATDGTHHRITQAPMGERSRIVRALRYLVERRAQSGAGSPCVSVSFIIQKGNFAEVALIAQEAAMFGFDNVEYVALGMNEASRDLQLSPWEQAQVHRGLGEAQRVLASAGRMTNAGRYLSLPPRAEWSRPVVTQTPCTIGQFFCRILADGSVDPCGCSRRVIGDAMREPIRDIWSSPGYRAFRREAFSLPRLGRPVDACGCYTCGHSQRIVNYQQTLGTGALPEIL